MVDRLSSRVRLHHAPQTKTGGGLRSRGVSIAYIIIIFNTLTCGKSSFLVGVVRCHRLGMVGCSQHYSCGRVVIDTGSCTYKMMKRFCVIRTTDAA